MKNRYETILDAVFLEFERQGQSDDLTLRIRPELARSRVYVDGSVSLLGLTKAIDDALTVWLCQGGKKEEINGETQSEG
jgi:hypothetical protein